MGRHTPLRTRGSDSAGWVALITFFVIAGLVICVLGIAYNGIGR